MERDDFPFYSTNRTEQYKVRYSYLYYKLYLLHHTYIIIWNAIPRRLILIFQEKGLYISQIYRTGDYILSWRQEH
jgi:hypothetical protein